MQYNTISRIIKDEPGSVRLGANGNAGCGVKRVSKADITISASGNPEDILFNGANLSSKQAKILEQLPKRGDKVILPNKGVSLNDLSALTASTGYV